jgi:hypothetical protein
MIEQLRLLPRRRRRRRDGDGVVIVVVPFHYDISIVDVRF